MTERSPSPSSPAVASPASVAPPGDSGNRVPLVLQGSGRAALYRWQQLSLRDDVSVVVVTDDPHLAASARAAGVPVASSTEAVAIRDQWPKAVWLFSGDRLEPAPAPRPGATVLVDAWRLVSELVGPADAPSTGATFSDVWAGWRIVPIPASLGDQTALPNTATLTYGVPCPLVGVQQRSADWVEPTGERTLPQLRTQRAWSVVEALATLALGSGWTQMAGAEDHVPARCAATAVSQRQAAAGRSGDGSAELLHDAWFMQWQLEEGPFLQLEMSFRSLPALGLSWTITGQHHAWIDGRLYERLPDGEIADRPLTPPREARHPASDVIDVLGWLGAIPGSPVDERPFNAVRLAQGLWRQWLKARETSGKPL